jgi:hypothetical protein
MPDHHIEDLIAAARETLNSMEKLPLNFERVVVLCKLREAVIRAERPC